VEGKGSGGDYKFVLGMNNYLATWVEKMG